MRVYTIWDESDLGALPVQETSSAKQATQLVKQYVRDIAEDGSIITVAWYEDGKQGYLNPTGIDTVAVNWNA